MSADADTVTLVQPGWRLAGPLDGVRRRCAATFDRLLPERAAAVAKALLLGDRRGLTREDRRRFVASGTMHLLAISGLHVGLLAVFARGLCKLAGAGPRASAAAVVLTVAAFALLAESRPPVLRAVLLVLFAAAGLGEPAAGGPAERPVRRRRGGADGDAGQPVRGSARSCRSSPSAGWSGAAAISPKRRGGGRRGRGPWGPGCGTATG